MRVVADSHAIVWYVQGSKRLSERASEVLAEAEAERSLVVSVATLIAVATMLPAMSTPVGAISMRTLTGALPTGAVEDAPVAVSISVSLSDPSLATTAVPPLAVKAIDFGSVPTRSSRPALFVVVGTGVTVPGP